MQAYTHYQPRDVVASIAYWPAGLPGSFAAEEYAQNISYRARTVDAREVTISDARNAREEFTLDTHGFQVLILPTTPRYTKDDLEIKAEQYPGLVEALTNITNASHIRIFSHTIRDLRPFDHIRSGNDPNIRTRPPALRPHTDFHAGACAALLASRHPLLARYIATAGRRWQILGVWRPLRTVCRSPLALCDSRTVDAERELVRVERQHGAGCVLSAPGPAAAGAGAAGGGHAWWYLPEQSPDEAWVVKHFDSSGEGQELGLELEQWHSLGVARQCVHTAFELPGTRGLPARESVEFRVLVVY